MGDNLKINILKKLQKNNKKKVIILVPKDFTFVIQPNFTSQRSFTGIWKKKYNSNWCFIQMKFIRVC
jgi:alkyl hydroperoxide reductase subunit AhpC